MQSSVVAACPDPRIFIEKGGGGQLRMKFQLPIRTKMLKNNDF